MDAAVEPGGMDDVFVGQLMSAPVLTIEPDTTIAEAGRAMLEASIKSVVVVDEDCRPEGILTSTDFVRIAAKERSPTDVTVAEYMTTDIVTTTAGTGVREAADLMREHELSHLPVVEADGTVTGMVTATDLTVYVSGVAAVADA